MNPKVIFPLVVAGCTGFMAVVSFAVRDPELDPRVRRLGGIGFAFVTLGCLVLARYEWLRGLLWPFNSRPTLIVGMLLAATGLYFQGEAMLAMMPDEVPARTRRTIVCTVRIGFAALVSAMACALMYMWIGYKAVLAPIGFAFMLVVLVSTGTALTLHLLKVEPIRRAKARAR